MLITTTGTYFEEMLYYAAHAIDVVNAYYLNIDLRNI